MALRGIRTVSGIGSQGNSSGSNNPLVITFTGSLGTVGVAYSGSIAASGGTSPYTYGIIGSLPGGLSLNTSTGAITGTPTTNGTYSFQGQVTDNIGHTALVNCSIMIGAAVGPLQISFSGSSVAFGFAANSALVATGGVQPYTYSTTTGSLPTGLSLNTSTGAITGTPTAVGNYTFTGKVTDNVGSAATISCTMYVTYLDVPGATINSASAQELAGHVFQNTNGGLQMVVQVNASVSSPGVFPVRCRVWFDFDDGNGWTLQGDQFAEGTTGTLTPVPQVWYFGSQTQITGLTIPSTIWVPTDPSKVSWQVAVEANSHDGQPSAAAVTNSFTVSPPSAASSTDLTGLSFISKPGSAGTSDDDFITYSRDDASGTYYWIPYEIDCYQPNINSLGPTSDVLDPYYKSGFFTVQLGYMASGTCTVSGGTTVSGVSGITLSGTDAGYECWIDGQLTTVSSVTSSNSMVTSSSVPNGSGLTIRIWRQAPIDATNGTQGADDPDAIAQGYRGRRFTDLPVASSLGMTFVRWQGNPQWSIQPVTNLDGTANLYRSFIFRAFAVSRLADSESGNSSTITRQTTWPTNSDGSMDYAILTPSQQSAAIDLTRVNRSVSIASGSPLLGGNGNAWDVAVSGALAKVSNSIVIADHALTSGYLSRSTDTGGAAISALNMQAASVTYANDAVAANTLVDSKVAAVNLGKLIAGTVVFNDDIILARGNGQAVVQLSNTGIWLYSSCTSTGTPHIVDGNTVPSGVIPGTAGNPNYTASGVASLPHVAIQSSQIGVFSGDNTVSSAIVRGNEIDLWTKNGDTTSPYAKLTASSFSMIYGSLSMTLTNAALTFSYQSGTTTSKSYLDSTQLQFLFSLVVGGSTVTSTLTLNSTGATVQSGTYSTSVSSSSVSITGPNGTLALTSNGLSMSSGVYSLQAYATSGLKIFNSATNHSFVVDSNYATIYSVDGDLSNPYFRVGSSSLTMSPSSNTNLVIDGNGITVTASIVTHFTFDSSGVWVFDITPGVGVNIGTNFLSIIPVDFHTSNSSLTLTYDGMFVTSHGLDNGIQANQLLLGGGQVVTTKQSGPGNPIFGTLAAAQTWCQNLLTALRTHGLVT